MSRFIFMPLVRTLGRGTKLLYSAAWYDRFRKEGLRFREMDEDVAFEDDPKWLMLPLERRQIALKRLEVMRDYERHNRPGDLEAENAAKRLGVTTGQFYRIRRQWNQNRSVFDLLPYGIPGATRRPKLDQEVHNTLNGLIWNAITNNGMRAPKDIMRAVEEGWSLHNPPPSHMTIRKNIAAALAKFAKVSGGGQILINPDLPSGEVENATYYGEVVAVDHIGLQVFVATDGGPVAPIATFAFDIFTSSICGVHLSFGAPGPLQFEAVLRDAERRSREAAPDAPEIKPRLIFEASGNSYWSRLMSRMEGKAYHAKIERTQRLNFGATIGKLMMGYSIGSIQFFPRRILNDFVFNPGKDALISFDELRNLIERGIEDINRQRIPPDTTRFQLCFEFLSPTVS